MAKVYKGRLNRRRSAIKIRLFPVASVMLASMLPMMLPIIASYPIVPPLGFMMFLAWRFLRPGLWPVWAAGLFGAFDDLFSGQPFGSAIFSWSLAVIFMELLDTRYVWREFWQDWFVAAMFIMGYIVLLAVINFMFQVPVSPFILLPQIALSICLFPLVLRSVAWVDSIRLAT